MSNPSAGNRFSDRGGAWVVAQFLLMTAVIVLGVLFQGDWTRWPIMATGLGLFFASAYFGIAGVRSLGRNRTPYPQPRENSICVQHGIYAHVRHPLYTSVMLGSVGWALIWDSQPSFLVALTLIPFFHLKAREEERRLCKTFAGYAAYAARVPRFFPRLGRAAPLNRP